LEKKHGDPQFFFRALFYLQEKLTIKISKSFVIPFFLENEKKIQHAKFEHRKIYRIVFLKWKILMTSAIDIKRYRTTEEVYIFTL
jgi:hypothetical protein